MDRSRIEEIRKRYNFQKVKESMKDTEEESNEAIAREPPNPYNTPLPSRGSSFDSDTEDSSEDDEQNDISSKNSDDLEKAMTDQELSDSSSSSSAGHRITIPVPKIQELSTQAELEDLVCRSVHLALVEVGWVLDPGSLRRKRGTLILQALPKARQLPRSSSESGTETEPSTMTLGLARSSEQTERTIEEVTAYYTTICHSMEDGIKFPRKDGKGSMILSYKTPGVNHDLLKKLAHETTDMKEFVKVLLTELRLITTVMKYCHYP
nr:MAG: putative phosphoprotein [Yongjia Tick Virus 2]WAK77067.1 MAG: putative phosphoprotein [Yongjia Tick Virus 2]WCS67455.1 MAG: putative phosphoprotein [Yongjia Tick Virus 2]